MSAAVCAICMTAVGADEAGTACPACHAPYHADCWSDNGGCAVYGCRMVPTTEGLKPLEIPPAFWGREDKNCPVCKATIAAMAVRCRHCGAEVQAKPEEIATYEKRKRRKERAPALRSGAIVFIIMAMIPIVAIITALGGRIFYSRNRDDIRRLPGSYDGLYRIAIGVATAQSVIIVLAVAAFWVKDMVR